MGLLEGAEKAKGMAGGCEEHGGRVDAMNAMVFCARFLFNWCAESNLCDSAK